MNDLRSPVLFERLSEREYQVFRMVAVGKSLKQIGDELHISDKTVSVFKVRAMQKMGIKTTAALVAYAMAHSMIKLKDGELVAV